LSLRIASLPSGPDRAEGFDRVFGDREELPVLAALNVTERPE